MNIPDAKGLKQCDCSFPNGEIIGHAFIYSQVNFVVSQITQKPKLSMYPFKARIEIVIRLNLNLNTKTLPRDPSPCSEELVTTFS